MGKLRIMALWVGFTMCGTAAFAQTEDNVAEDLADEISYSDGFADSDDGSVGMEDMLSHFQRLKKHPVNINAASRRELAAMLLLTPFQIESILSRVKSSGAILSYAELSLLYGFDEKTVERLRPYIALGEVVRRPENFLKDQKTSVFTRYQRSFSPDAEAYLARGRFSYLDKIDASIVYKGNSSMESASSLTTFGVSYSGIKAGGFEVEKIVAGDFYARLGQGLTSWNGFQLSAGTESSGYAKHSEPLSLYTSSDTSKLLRGIAVSASWNGLKMSGGYSFKGEVCLMRISYMKRRVRYGLSYTGQRYVSNVFAADIMLGGAGGLVAFAEAAVSSGAFAFLGGMSLDLGTASLHIMLRSYQKDFISPYGGAYSSISKLQNQYGVSLRAVVPVYRKLSLALGADYTAYPYPRYRIKEPSATFKGYVKLSMDDAGFGTSARNQLWVKGYYKYDLRYSYPVKASCSFSVKSAGTVYVARFLSLGARVEFNTLKGRALSLSVRSSAGKELITFSGGVIAFSAPNWDGRIYFPQAELPYTFSSTLLYGKGTDAYALVKTRLSRRLSLYFKYQYNRGKSMVRTAVSADF